MFLKKIPLQINVWGLGEWFCRDRYVTIVSCFAVTIMVIFSGIMNQVLSVATEDYGIDLSLPDWIEHLGFTGLALCYLGFLITNGVIFLSDDSPKRIRYRWKLNLPGILFFGFICLCYFDRTMILFRFCGTML